MPDFSFEERDQMLERALKIAQERHPDASAQKHAAFANSVAYFVTSASGGYGGPSVREHVATRVKLQRASWTFDEAVAELIGEDGVIFGPLMDLHKQCWAQEHCFNDDPDDLIKLSGELN